MNDVRDPNGRLGDLARYVLQELAEIDADFDEAQGAIASAETLGRTRLIDAGRLQADLYEAALRLAGRLEGYSEMPEAKSQRSVKA